jgi:ribose transport system ATP-binding protein
VSARGGIPAVEVAGLRKHYGGVVALDGMDLAVARGTIHAIVGENGAGKSTLMKILAGAVQPDAGEVRVAGEIVELDTPAAARRRGIGISYQELSLFPERSILANLYVEHEPTRRGLVDGRAMLRQATPILRRIGLPVDPSTPVGQLGLAERQLVELSRLLIERPEVLILDEPNSALNERETGRLFTILRELSASGVTIVYVSHRLEEMFAIADRMTVMRNGRAVLEADRAELTIPGVVRAMIGAAQETLFPPRAGATGTGEGSTADTAAALPARRSARGALAVEDLRVEGALHGISFRAEPGEIVGLAGLEGAGISALLGVLSELPEVVGLADRIIVLYRGRIAGEVRGGEIDDRGLLHAINTGSLADDGVPSPPA